jgi:hypothetical protein
MILTRIPAALAAAALGVGLLAAGCSKGGSSSTPVTPTTPTTNIAGSWAGTATDSSGPGLMAWTIAQSGSGFSGTVSLTDVSSGVKGTGSLSGSVSGTTLAFTMSIPAGGFGEPYASCSANASGQGTISGASISAAYSGSSSCSAAIAGGIIK